jgi:glycosyltransferase involved in cell wall biosynthesis
MSRGVSFEMAIAVLEGNNSAKLHGHILNHTGIRILIDRYRRGGVGNKDKTDPILHSRFLHSLVDGMSDIDEISSPGTSHLKSQFNARSIFVYQGRIAPEKNVEALLRAWQKANMGPDCKLLIVGDGPLRTSLEPFYDSEYGIIWLGFVADEQRRIDILRGSDVFILPSLAEGLSLSLLEAMACGIACVATDVGADGEVLEGGAGLVINPQRVKTELQTLLPLLRDHKDFISTLGRNARARVMERYTLSRNIVQLEELYQQVLEKPIFPMKRRA